MLDPAEGGVDSKISVVVQVSGSRESSIMEVFQILPIGNSNITYYEQDWEESSRSPSSPRGSY